MQTLSPALSGFRAVQAARGTVCYPAPDTLPIPEQSDPDEKILLFAGRIPYFVKIAIKNKGNCIMKKIAFTLLSVVLLSTACSQQGEYTVTGTIEGLEGRIMLLTLNEEGDFVPVDSAEVTDGTFTFTGSVPGAQMARMTIDGRPGPSFFLENAEITIEGKADSLREAVISGSSTQDIMNGINKKMTAIGKEMQPIIADYRAAQQANDSETMKKALERYNELSEKRLSLVKEEAKENSANAVGPYFVYRQLRYDLTVPEMQEWARGFTGAARKTVYYSLLQETISTLENVAVGKVAPDFEMENPEGKMIKLSDFRGKYLLIDFWASWCGPCRKENPNVVKLYKEVQGKDFDILGVSLDNSREAWLKGIEEDGLIWSHVSDVKGWDNRVAKLYGVSSIPHTVLLDKEGVIIEKNLRGEELREKVMELVN